MSTQSETGSSQSIGSDCVFHGSSRALESCAFFQGPKSLLVDSLDSTDEPHPRFPVQGYILNVGEDALKDPTTQVWQTWSNTSQYQPSTDWGNIRHVRMGVIPALVPIYIKYILVHTQLILAQNQSWTQYQDQASMFKGWYHTNTYSLQATLQRVEKRSKAIRGQNLQSIFPTYKQLMQSSYCNCFQLRIGVGWGGGPTGILVLTSLNWLVKEGGARGVACIHC